jgi:hypothetical protein
MPTVDSKPYDLHLWWLPIRTRQAPGPPARVASGCPSPPDRGGAPMLPTEDVFVHVHVLGDDATHEALRILTGTAFDRSSS